MNRLPVIVRQHIAGFRILLVFTVICGFVYPLVMLGVSQVVFHNQANGSLVSYNGHVVGSSLLCQEFVDAKGNPLPQYFQPRPSYAIPSARTRATTAVTPLLVGIQPRAHQPGPGSGDHAAAEADLGVRSRSGLGDPGGRGDRVRVRA